MYVWTLLVLILPRPRSQFDPLRVVSTFIIEIIETKLFQVQSQIHDAIGLGVRSSKTFGRPWSSSCRTCRKVDGTRPSYSIAAGLFTDLAHMLCSDQLQLLI